MGEGDRESAMAIGPRTTGWGGIAAPLPSNAARQSVDIAGGMGT